MIIKTCQNMQNAAKAVLRGKFIILNDYITKAALKSIISVLTLRNCVGGGGAN